MVVLPSSLILFILLVFFLLALESNVLLKQGSYVAMYIETCIGLVGLKPCCRNRLLDCFVLLRCKRQVHFCVAVQTPCSFYNTVFVPYSTQYLTKHINTIFLATEASVSYKVYLQFSTCVVVSD